MSKVKVRVHVAQFTNDPTEERYYFINVRNNHKRRHITVTDVFFIREVHEIVTKQHNITVWGHVYNADRKLPVVVLPQTEWETWLTVANVGPRPIGLQHFVVRLSTGRYIVSKKRKGVAPSGVVPGSSN